jgi:hypothetical protein
MQTGMFAWGRRLSPILPGCWCCCRCLVSRHELAVCVCVWGGGGGRGAAHVCTDCELTSACLEACSANAMTSVLNESMHMRVQSDKAIT